MSKGNVVHGLCFLPLISEKFAPKSGNPRDVAPTNVQIPMSTPVKKAGIELDCE